MKTKKEEIWKDIAGFEGIYQISNFGRVKSLGRYSIQKHWVTEKLLNSHPNNSGYLDVSLYDNGKRIHKKIHRLVAEAFIPNPNNLPEVDHIDTNKYNNHVSNLRWCTSSENHLNPITRKHRSDNLKGRKLSQEQIKKMSKQVNVYKDSKFICSFSSYQEMDKQSKDVLGVTLWNVYARQVVRGLREQYKGFTFTIGEAVNEKCVV